MSKAFKELVKKLGLAERLEPERLKEIVEDVNAGNEDLIKAMDYGLRELDLEGDETILLKAVKGLVLEGEGRSQILEILDGLSKPRDNERKVIQKYILKGVSNPENYDFSHAKGWEKGVTLVYDGRVPPSVREDLQEMLLEELGPKKEKIDKIYLVLHHQKEPYMKDDFVGVGSFVQPLKTLTPLKIGAMAMNVTEFTKLKDDEKRYLIRHELLETILEGNDVPREIGLPGTKLSWYEGIRNAIIDTLLLLEDHKEAEPMFYRFRRKLLEEESSMRRVKRKLKFTQEAVRKKYPAYLSLHGGLFSLRAAAPFKIAGERDSSHRGSFNHYYRQLDKIAKRKEGYVSPVGTRFRYTLENELLDFKVVDDKIDEGFCQHVYKVANSFVRSVK